MHDLNGNLLGVVDLLDVDGATAGEYDGADHAAPERRALDHACQQAIEDHRLRVVRAAGPDLTRYRRRTVDRLTRRHHRGLLRDPAADLWVPASARPRV